MRKSALCYLALISIFALSVKNIDINLISSAFYNIFIYVANFMKFKIYQRFTSLRFFVAMH
jgi:hypothetical protein